MIVIPAQLGIKRSDGKELEVQALDFHLRGSGTFRCQRSSQPKSRLVQGLPPLSNAGSHSEVVATR